MKKILILILIFNNIKSSNTDKIIKHNPNNKINMITTALISWTLTNSLQNTKKPSKTIKAKNFYKKKQKFSKRNHQPKR